MSLSSQILNDSYVCGSHSFAIFKNGTLITVPLYCGRVCGPLSCDSCAQRRAQKYAERLQVESDRNDLRYVVITDDDELKSTRRNLSRYKTRFGVFAQEDGSAVVVFDADNKLPIDEDRMLDLPEDLETFAARICRTPKGKKIGGTRTKYMQDGTVERHGFGTIAEPKREDEVGEILRLAVSVNELAIFADKNPELRDYLVVERWSVAYTIKPGKEAALRAWLENRRLIVKDTKSARSAYDEATDV